MHSTLRLRRVPRRGLGLLPLVLVATGCSLINRFDDVKQGALVETESTGGAGMTGGVAGGTSAGSGSDGSASASGTTGAGGSSDDAGGGSGDGGGSSVEGGSTMGGGSGDGGGGSDGGASLDAGTSGTAGQGDGGLGLDGAVAMSEAGVGDGAIADSAIADGAMADGAIVDAAQDGADQGTPPPRVLTCQFTQAVPRLLDDFQSMSGADRTVNDGLAIQPVGNGTSVRILAQHAGNPGAYLEYFASDTPSGMMAQVIPSNGRLVDVTKKDPNTTDALVIDQGDPTMGSQPAQLDLHQFDDAISQSIPTVTTLTNPNQLGTSYDIEARFSPTPDGSIAVAASYQLPGGQYRAAYGLFTGTPVDLIPLKDDPNPDVVRPQAIVRAPNAATYVFMDQSSPTEFEILDGRMPTSRTFPGTAFVVDASMSANGKINVIMADFGTSLRLLVGQIDPSQAMTFDSTQLAVAKEVASVTEIPFSTPTIVVDQLMMLGPTGTGRELSFLWVDMAGHPRASQKLMDTTGLVKTGAVAPRDTLSPTLGGRFHVVWVERLGDTNGDYDRIYYDQLQCL